MCTRKTKKKKIKKIRFEPNLLGLTRIEGMVLRPPPGEDAPLLGELPVVGEPRDLKDDVIFTGECFLAGDLFMESTRFKGEFDALVDSTLLTGDPKLLTGVGVV